MATILTPYDTDNAGQGTNTTTGTTTSASPVSSGSTNSAPQISGGSNAIATGGGGGTGTTVQGAKPSANPTGTSSGSFQNLQKYMNANQGFDAAQGGLAGEINQNAGAQADQSNQSVQNAFNNFNNQANTASNSFSAPNVANAANNISVNNIGNATSAQIQQADQLANAQYTGPTQINQSDIANLTNQGNNLSQMSQQANTESGRMSLLNQMFGNANYGNGQQSLDNLFLQNNPTQTNALKNLTTIANNYNQNLNNTENQATQVANADQAAASTAAQTLQGAAQNTANNWVQNLNATGANGNTTQANDLSAWVAQQTPAVQAQLAQASATNTLPAAIASQLGLTNGQNLYGVTFNSPSYITNPSANSLAPQDYQALQNIQSLLGGGINMASQPGTTAALGTLLSGGEASNPTINAAAIQSALNTAQNTYQTAAQADQKALNNASSGVMSALPMINGQYQLPSFVQGPGQQSQWATTTDPQAALAAWSAAGANAPGGNGANSPAGKVAAALAAQQAAQQAYQNLNQQYQIGSDVYGNTGGVTPTVAAQTLQNMPHLGGIMKPA